MLRVLADAGAMQSHFVFSLNLTDGAVRLINDKMSKFLYVSLSGDAIAYLGGKKGSNELLKKFKEMFISINKARTCAKDC